MKLNTHFSCPSKGTKSVHFALNTQVSCQITQKLTYSALHKKVWFSPQKSLFAHECSTLLGCDFQHDPSHEPRTKTILHIPSTLRTPHHLLHVLPPITSVNKECTCAKAAMIKVFILNRQGTHEQTRLSAARNNTFLCKAL